MKSQIIEQLGQAEILLPSLVAEGLAANDRIKVRMSALQAAAHHAQEPDDRDMQELGTAAVHLLTMATSYVNSHQDEDQTPTHGPS